MKNQVLKDYLFHLVPAVLFPTAMYLFDGTIPLPNLFRMGLLFPLLLLAMRGLTVFFPSENLRNRSTGRVAEYAILQGLVLAAFIVLFNGVMQPELQARLAPVLRQFAIAAVVFSTSNFGIALHARSKLRAS